LIAVALVGTVLVAQTAAIAILLRRCRRLLRHVADVQSRRRAQLRLNATEQAETRSARRRYLGHFQDSPVPVLLTTPDGEIVAANRALVELLGYEGEADIRRCNAADLYANPLDRVIRTRARLEQHGQLRNAELKFKRKDGVRIDVLNTVRVLRFADGAQLYEGVCTDITALRRAADENLALLAQLHLSQKLEAVGQLAAGIAHEINTPIQFVGDNAYFLRDAFQKLIAVLQRCREIMRGAPEVSGELLKIDREAKLDRLALDVAQAFEESFEGISRVTEIVRAMKEFAHPGDGEVSAVDINQTIHTTLVVARNEYKQVADIVTDFAELRPVMCRKGEINKVVLNLLVNAAHAIERKIADGGGRGAITLRTRADAQHVIITISDTGCGIPPAVIGRIFDPFFTTKPVGKGTGQGLAIARAVIKSHGGHIEVESTPGQGARFTITIPFGEEPAADTSIFEAPPAKDLQTSTGEEA